MPLAGEPDVDHRGGPSALVDVVVMAGGAWVATGERLDVAGLDLTVWATLDGGRAVCRAPSGALVRVETRWLVSIETARWDPERAGLL